MNDGSNRSATGNDCRWKTNERSRVSEVARAREFILFNITILRQTCVCVYWNGSFFFFFFFECRRSDTEKMFVRVYQQHRLHNNNNTYGTRTYYVNYSYAN